MNYLLLMLWLSSSQRFIQFDSEPDGDRCVVWQGCEEVDVEVMV